MEKGAAENLFKKIIEKYVFLDVKLLGKHKWKILNQNSKSES